MSGRGWSGAWADATNGVILFVAVLALLAAGTYGIRKVLLPAEEELRREVYEESKSYRDGTIRDLDNLRLQWADSEGTHRRAIAATARHRAADFPRDALPDRIREWLEEIEP